MLIHPQFDPVAIHLGPLAVHWYGLMYLVAFMLFLWLGKLRIRTLNRPGWDEKMMDDLLFYGILGVVLGGRLGEVLFYNPGYYVSRPLEILAVWQGGLHHCPSHEAERPCFLRLLIFYGQRLIYQGINGLWCQVFCHLALSACLDSV